MANYNIDFLVSIKNTNKLVAFNKQLDQTGKKVRETVQGLSEIGQTSKFGIANIIGYGNALRKAQTNFNEAVRGAKEFKAVSRELVNAERQYNSELQKRQAILESIRKGSNFAQFSRGASQVASPTVFDTATQKSIERNRRNMNKRLGRTPVPFGPQQFIGPMPMLPMQGPMLPSEAASLRRAEARQLPRQRGDFGFGSAGDPIAKSIRRNKERQFKDLLKEKKANKEIRDMKAAQLRLQRSQNRALRQGVLETQKLAKTTAGSAKSGQSGPGFFRGGARGAIGSAAIGGGFPLLFGQGGLGALGGGVGGALGGAIGGQFGFSLSIVGTVIAQQIQQAIDFRKEIDKVNTAIKETGGTSTFTASQINNLAKELKMTKDEVLSAVNAFGGFDAAQRTILTQVFGDPSTFKLYASISKDANSLISAIQPLIDANEISITQAQKTLEILNKGGLDEAKVYLENLKEQKELDIEIQKINKVTLEDRQKADAIFKQFFYQDQDGIVRSLGILEKMTEEEQKRYTQMFKAEFFRDERVKALIDENELNKQQTRELLELQRQITEELERQAIIQAPKDELKKLLDPLRQVDALSRSVGASFAESFKGIVKGSMSAQDALRNLFQRTADHFLDMAAQILAAQIRAGIMGLFSNMFGGFSVTGGRSLTTASGTNIGTAGFMPSNPIFRGAKAEGGPVKGGASYLVGERGPEMFTPGVSGMVTPNHALGGSTNIVVNVDASGSNVEGDEEQGRQLGQLISAAIQSELIKQKRPGGMLA